jgi:hypothetical protein
MEIDVQVSSYATSPQQSFDPHLPFGRDVSFSEPGHQATLP